MKTYEIWKNISDRDNCVVRKPKEEKKDGIQQS